MNKDLLYLFFKGEASLEEGLKIKAWMEASEENSRTFYREREIFDALMLAGPFPNTSTTIDDERDTLLKSSLFRKVRMECLKIASAILLTLICSYLYQEYTTSRQPMTMNIVSVPEGQRANVTLPDGTHVWINARTTLEYPASFDKEKRMVFLKGEAYFDVKRNEKKPFVVRTNDYDIEVLGTKFNVNAYLDMDEFETALMSGSVKITSLGNIRQSVTLKPKHKLSLEGGILKVNLIQNYDAYRWKEGLICFHDETFPKIMHSFEKYYGIKIIIKNKSILKHSFTGKFRQSDGVDYALQTLQNNIEFKYEKDDEKQIIYII